MPNPNDQFDDSIEGLGLTFQEVSGDVAGLINFRMQRKILTELRRLSDIVAGVEEKYMSPETRREILAALQQSKGLSDDTQARLREIIGAQDAAEKG